MKTPTMAELFSEELKTEADTTRRFLQRLPADKLAWKPHEKSLSAGTLALHIAEIPGGITHMAMTSTYDMGKGGPTFNQPETVAQIVDTFDSGMKVAIERLSKFTDEQYESEWKLTMGGVAMMTMPLRTMVRTILFNQMYHHRGQFGVYLRVMGTTVPWAYGPSGDEMPPGLAEKMSHMPK